MEPKGNVMTEIQKVARRLHEELTAEWEHADKAVRDAYPGSLPKDDMVWIDYRNAKAYAEDCRRRMNDALYIFRSV